MYAGESVLLSGSMLIPLLTIVAVMALAFANGANDVSKGIATLAGSRRATYRQALAWGTLWTAAGASAAAIVSIGLIEVFTSSLVADDVLAMSSFPLAVTAGASVWVLCASATGLPVSTTHALTGAIVGAALSTGSIDAIRWGLLLSGIAAPLALSPLVSGLLGYSLHGVACRIESACVCAGDQIALPIMNADGTLAVRSVPTLVTSAVGCDPAPGRVRLMAGHVTHWGAAAAISFARGVNDSSKIAMLGTLAFASVGAGVASAFALTALAMTVGSFAAGLRVSRTLGEIVWCTCTPTRAWLAPWSQPGW
ncbi:MAG: hypothetical protein A3H29_02565 [Acidobacteria bacterium RIFCSPLOWO2_02_FULL_67_21]|nr:MAG: hypothetical protein A3H29_02565 [Acidobacteria bacterium RIFCSPLOWO2_02_FULL_67_21]